MRELAELLDRLRGLGDAPAAMVTVARVEGSSYRREGARMLVEPDGRLTGVLTGGCLERDLVALAREVLDRRSGRTVHFDLSAEEEAFWGTGTGCAGRLTLLVEPIDERRRRELLDLLSAVVDERREVRLVTVFDSGGPDGDASGSGAAVGPTYVFPFDRELSAPPWAAQASAEISRAVSGTARSVEIEAEGRRFALLVESILPPIHLLLVGAERDAPPLARIALELGWKVTVVEPRPRESTAERFERSATYRGVSPPDLSSRVELSPRTAAVLATHRYLDDLAYLEPLLAAPLGYLGLLGPVRRRERLLADLERRAPAAAAAAQGKLRGPAGLDLGGRSPHEVALAIVAEIQAVFAKADGRPLSWRVSRDARLAER